MTIETAARVFRWLREASLLGSEVECRWHAGEPLAMRPTFYREAMRAIARELPDDTLVHHSVQTNGTLVDEAWIELFQESGMRVGLSIDGPQFLHDHFRRDRGGRGSFVEARRAAALLRDAGIPFEVIAVVTEATLPNARALYECMVALGAARLGLNIEETEGPHTSPLAHREDFVEVYQQFFQEMYECQKDGRVPIREVEALRLNILDANGDALSLQAHPFSILTVGTEGEMMTFSPELLGLDHPAYGTFALGNVWHDSLVDILRRPAYLRLSAEIGLGTARCQECCEYFSICGGGAPINKLFENGSLDSTATAYCRARIQIPADLLVPDLEAEAMRQADDGD